LASAAVESRTTAYRHIVAVVYVATNISSGLVAYPCFSIIRMIHPAESKGQKL